jgi:hypothetical protein
VPIGRLFTRGRAAAVGEERAQVAPRHSAGIRDDHLVHPVQPAQLGAAAFRALAGDPGRAGRGDPGRDAGRELRRRLPALGLRARQPLLGEPPARDSLRQQGESGPLGCRRADGFPHRPPPRGHAAPGPVAMGRADRRPPGDLAATAHPAAASPTRRRRDPLRRRPRPGADHRLPSRARRAERPDRHRHPKRQPARAARPGRPAADADTPVADPHRPPGQRDLPMPLRLPLPGHRRCRPGRGRGVRRPLPLRPKQDRPGAGQHPLSTRRPSPSSRNSSSGCATGSLAAPCLTSSPRNAPTPTAPSPTATPTTAGH